MLQLQLGWTLAEKNCTKYLAEKKAENEAQGNYDLIAVETCLVEYDTST